QVYLNHLAFILSTFLFKFTFTNYLHIGAQTNCVSGPLLLYLWNKKRAHFWCHVPPILLVFGLPVITIFIIIMQIKGGILRVKKNLSNH
ncbi:hypothetical protein ACJX0J_040333, partial [Zea mays]